MKPPLPSGSALLDLDWESINKKLQSSPTNDGGFYMIAINKGQPGEYRTKFMSHAETEAVIRLALEKKRLRVPITLP